MGIYGDSIFSWSASLGFFKPFFMIKDADEFRIKNNFKDLEAIFNCFIIVDPTPPNMPLS